MTDGEIYHRCRRCACCHICTCDDYHAVGGRCRACAEWMEFSEWADAYYAAVAEGGWFIQTHGERRMIHTAGCQLYKGHARRVAAWVDLGCLHEGAYFTRPDLVRAGALEPGARCRLCAPGVTPPPRPPAPVSAGPPERVWWRKSGTGWPSEPRRSLTDVLGHSRGLPGG